MDTALDERHSHHEGSRAGLKPAPIFFASFALFAISFSCFVLPSALLRVCFVVKFSFAVYWLRLRRTTIFEITDVCPIGGTYDCINHEQFVKRELPSKIVRENRANHSNFQGGNRIGVGFIVVFGCKAVANLRQMYPLKDNTFSLATSFSLKDTGTSAV
jgi:hypothetical protein